MTAEVFSEREEASLQEKTDHPVISLTVRLMPHGEVKPGFLICDALLLGKGLEFHPALVGIYAVGKRPCLWPLTGPAEGGDFLFWTGRGGRMDTGAIWSISLPNVRSCILKMPGYI